MKPSTTKKVIAAVAAACLAVMPIVPSASAQSASGPHPDPREWRNWANGPGAPNFSAADQINGSNVGQLRPVWEYRLPQRGGWELTPIVVGGVLYGLDMQGNAFALDPETGKEIWKFATGIKGNNRSVSYWAGDANNRPRIVVAVIDRIYALDAETGKPAAGFGGAAGFIDIRDGFTPKGPSYRITSPVTIYKNLLIHGVSTQEFGSKGPPGDPRAYDAVTGKLVWRFDIVPKAGQKNFGTWGPGGEKDRSGPSTWGIFTVDAETGTLFIPVGQPADNYVGIDRPGDNLYSDSVLALDAATGRYKWHFQTVHHDLWDFDLSAPPSLIDLNVKGRKVPALVQATKMGLMFILDRRTGKPVFGVEERPVPQSMIPGEVTSPTQPFPIKPAPLARLGITVNDLSTITPETHAYCTAQWHRLGLQGGPMYTPPSLAGPLVYSPANAGGAGGVWGGVSINPNTNTIFVNVGHLVSYVRVEADDGGPSKARGASTGGYRTEDAFTKFVDQNGMPCIQPPWGEMVAINGNTGDILWKTPLGKSEPYGELGEHTGMLNYGGSLATAGGLVFIGGITMACSQCKYDEPVIRAFDQKTGREVWSARLSAGTKSNLMTYVGKSGRQYLIVTTGGRPDTDIAMVAFAIPRPGEKPIDVRPAPRWPTSLGKAAAPAAISKAEDLPPGPGKDEFARVCTMCHGMATSTGMRADLNGWNTIIANMRTRGAPLDNETHAKIANYLAANFAPSAQARRNGPNGEPE